MFTIEAKSQLAKLLATENLTITHQKIQTAKFDPANRVLYCPIWKDMSGDMYDLLMGHEVGHARYTPAEGWHNAISGRGGNFKGFLNVVEDARIEKKIKRKYPGIRQPFIRGYQSLLDRDFFGIKGRDINSLSFIDRLNIYTKSSGTVIINFTDDEVLLVNQVESCETWEDVLRVTEVIFDYSKDEQSQLQIPMSNDLDGNEYELSDEELDSDTNEDIDSSEDTDSNEDVTDYDDFEPTCDTDEAFRNKESELLNDVCKPFIYANIPLMNLDDIVTPAKIVHRSLTDHFINGRPGNTILLNGDVKKFKSKNDRYIGLLAKEFEMKKAARSYAKAKVSSTGDIDLSKIYKYTVDDNIFRKMTRLPKGKSHGLVLLLDNSASMRPNMGGSIEQILVLTMFCRKVNIPFVVYGFGDNIMNRMHDFPNQRAVYYTEPKENDLYLKSVFLREYLNSKMSITEFNNCVRNMIALRNSYNEPRSHNHPVTETLSNTPLIQAMVALAPIVLEFRKMHNLDLVNLVIVHDGDADPSDYVHTNWTQGLKGVEVNNIIPRQFSAKTQNVYIRDQTNTKIQIKVDFHTNESHYKIDDSLRVAIFKWFGQVTGAKIFGFFITGKNSRLAISIASKYYDKKGRSVKEICNTDNIDTRYKYYRSNFVSTLCKKLRADKYIESHNPGYESFFIMPGGDNLQIDDEEMNIIGPVTSTKLKRAFSEMNKKRQVNRIMVSRFIEGIAA